MRVRKMQLSSIGGSTFGTKSRAGGHSGVAGLGEIKGGWNVLPALDNAQRAIPTNAKDRNLGQDFSIALNAALQKHGVEGQVQNDGVISLFHIEMLGNLLIQPGVGSAFPSNIADRALDMMTNSEVQKEVLLSITGGGEIADLTSRIVFVGSDRSPGRRAAPPKKAGGLAIPIAVGGILILGLLASRR